MRAMRSFNPSNTVIITNPLVVSFGTKRSGAQAWSWLQL
jgi:hypothetical protein